MRRELRTRAARHGATASDHARCCANCRRTSPQGPSGRTPFDLDDYLDDYAVDRRLRNDLGLLWLVALDAAGPVRVEGVP